MYDVTLALHVMIRDYAVPGDDILADLTCKLTFPSSFFPHAGVIFKVGDDSFKVAETIVDVLHWAGAKTAVVCLAEPMTLQVSYAELPATISRFKLWDLDGQIFTDRLQLSRSWLDKHNRLYDDVIHTFLRSDGSDWLAVCGCRIPAFLGTQTEQPVGCKECAEGLLSVERELDRYSYLFSPKGVEGEKVS